MGPLMEKMRDDDDDDAKKEKITTKSQRRKTAHRNTRLKRGGAKKRDRWVDTNRSK